MGLLTALPRAFALVPHSPFSRPEVEFTVGTNEMCRLQYVLAGRTSFVKPAFKPAQHTIHLFQMRFEVMIL